MPAMTSARAVLNSAKAVGSVLTVGERRRDSTELAWGEKTEMGAGHGGPSGRYDAWRDEALILAFLLDAFGMSTVDAPAGTQ